MHTAGFYRPNEFMVVNAFYRQLAALFLPAITIGSLGYTYMYRNDQCGLYFFGLFVHRECVKRCFCPMWSFVCVVDIKGLNAVFTF